jgi:PAS domain S-box-containing protein
VGKQQSDSPQQLDQQIDDLIRLTDQIRTIFTRGNYTLPSHFFEQLDQFSVSLHEINRHLNQLEQGNRGLLALVEISQVVNSSLDLNTVLRIVMDTIIYLTKAERGFLMLRNKDGSMAIRIARNWGKESIPPADTQISRSVVRQVFLTRKPVLTTNAREDPRFSGQDSVVNQNLRSILCAPLKFRSEFIGIIYVDNRTRAGVFGASERDLLTAFANQAAIAIENARLYQSTRSSLTEVSSLKGFMDKIFTSIASGVITTDQNDRITMVNQAAEQILGAPDSKLIGSSIRDVFGDGAEELFQSIGWVWKNELPLLGIEQTIVLPTRPPVTLRMNISPLKEDGQSKQGVAIVLDDISENKKLRAQRRLFERMVSPAVINELNPDELQLGGKKTQITTLFADIRGFTSLSEQISPEQLVGILNLYLAAAAEAVLTHQGTIDKFQGDALMAWFNAPIPQENHPQRAVQAAIDLQIATCDLQNRMNPQNHLSFGVGIHTGEAVLGLIGTDKRLDYTAIGDSINIAKRIQENAAPGQILVSAELHAYLAGHFNSREHGIIQLKGRSRAVRVYEVLP